MQKEERILCKSCGKNFGYLSYFKNCKECEFMFRKHCRNTICRRCHKIPVTCPRDPMCYSCYKEIERKNAKLVAIYHQIGVVLDEKNVS